VKSCSTFVKSDITSIALGGFDGMHLGHQELFSNLSKNGAIVVIETGYANLTPKIYRQEYTHYPIYYYPLEEIKHLNGEQFIILLKEEYPNLEKIVVGYDFHFGKNRKYSTNSLKELFNGEVIVVEEVKYKDISVHSRVIRNYLSDGECEIANELLDKPYKIYGYQTTGQGLGKKQFVPTININCNDFLLPKEGIYATKTIVNEKEFYSVSFIGHRVSTDGKFAVETHIIDEELEDIKGKIQIKFLSKIRDNKKFENYEDLKKQILIDIENVKIFHTSII
jgi:riboflavin kinase/FMN adenylyltransferase